MKKVIAVILCLLLCVSLLPTAAFAAGATVQYLDITFDGNGNATGCTYIGDAAEAEGILISGGDPYTLDSNWDGLIIVSDATVSYAGSSTNFFVLGTGSLNLGSVTVGAGGNSTTYPGANGGDLLTFIGGLTSVPSYHFTNNYDLVGSLDAYAVTVDAGKTLTVKYDSNTSGEGASNPGSNASILRVFNTLTVHGTLTADPGQRLEIAENAVVSGITLYDSDKESIYTLSDTYESFEYMDTSNGGTPVMRWVRLEQGPTRPGDGEFNLWWDNYTPEGGGSAAAGIVKYSIDGATEQTAVLNSCTAIGIGADLAISVTPPKSYAGEYEGFWGIRVTTNGDNPQNDTLVSVLAENMTESAGIYTYTIARGEDATAGFLIEICWSDPNQGGGGDGTPQYSLRFDSNDLSVTRGGTAVDTEIQNEGYPEQTANTDDLVFTFTANQDRNFYGLKVITDGSPSYIKKGSARLAETGSGTDVYTYTIPESSFTTNIEIEAISWAAAFDNEFIVFYDPSDGAGVGFEATDATGDPAALNDADICAFTEDTEYTFTLTPPSDVTAPYKVLIEPNDGETVDKTSEAADNSFTYTPDNSTGLTIRLYWTQAQYDFDNLQSEDDQFQIEYTWSGNGAVTHDSTNPGVVDSATYNDCTRVNLANGTENLVLTLTPTPAGTPENEVTEVQVEGQTVNATDYSGGTYTLTLNNNFKRVEVRFTQSTPGGDPSVETYTITTYAGEHGSIDPDISNINAGSNVNVNITPDDGWKIGSVVIDGGESSGGSSLNEQEIEEVTSDGYFTFSNIFANHSITVTFEEDSAGEVDDLKTYIEDNIWAYWDENTATTDAAKTLMAEELWDVANHEYVSVFLDAEAVTASITVTGGSSSESFAGQTLYYYEYSVMLKDNEEPTADIVATGKIYRLAQMQDFILAATNGDDTTYTVMSLNTRGLSDDPDMSPCIDTTFVVDYDTVAFYGIRIEGSTGRTDYSDSFHVSGQNNIGCRIILYKPAFAGAIATAHGITKHAAAWDFGNYPFVCLTGTTSAAPFELIAYFGATSVTLDLPVSDNSLALDAITGITTSLPDGAVTINASTITFNSNFYDVIPLTITYTDGVDSHTGYLSIHRAGIDIQNYGTTHDNQISCTILHGTQNGSTFNWDGDSYAIYATYYYPMETVAPTDRVDLYATYTWANGSVTTELVSKAAGDNGDSYFLPADDFCLYKGSESGAPTSVSVIAVKSGSNSTTFAGATLGSGAGVSWSKN